MASKTILNCVCVCVLCRCVCNYVYTWIGSQCFELGQQPTSVMFSSERLFITEVWFSYHYSAMDKVAVSAMNVNAMLLMLVSSVKIA